MADMIESSSRIPRERSDLDQAIRYLRSADEILRRSGSNALGLRNAIEDVITRMLPGDQRPVIETAGHITVMRGMAQKARELKQPDAATEILKAVAVLRDRRSDAP